MEKRVRPISRLIEPIPVTEGAGVRLKRSIATPLLNYLDPFLLWDHFGSKNRLDYEAGFPLHPHRGIETVTYILSGEVHHKDTMGNSGSITSGDIQWMTAGGGLMHEEMPMYQPEGIDGFQLWVNLPAKYKMMAPRYQEVRSSQIPQVHTADGATIRLIAGRVGDVRGPVTEIAVDPLYMDISLPRNSSFEFPVNRGHNAFAYIFEGEGFFGSENRAEAVPVKALQLLIWEDGDFIKVFTGAEPTRFMLVAGKPLNEPVARYGPFVMNTKEEIQQALQDLKNGTFVHP